MLSKMLGECKSSEETFCEFLEQVVIKFAAHFIHLVNKQEKLANYKCSRLDPRAVSLESL